MKKFIIAAIALIVSVCSAYADEYVTLYRFTITDMKDSKVSFDFAKNPIITFKDNVFYVELDENDILFSIDNVRNITFSTYQQVVGGVESIVDENAEITLIAAGTQLKAAGMPAGESVSVFSVDGRLLFSTVADANGSASIELSSFPKGVYIAKAGKVSLKFIK